MDLKHLFADDDAVSPVIGVILMVAITVILAAVIGAFVLGIGGSQETVPQASFSWEEDSSGNVDVTHEGGGAIEVDRLSFSGACTNSFGITSGSVPFSAGDVAECTDGKDSEASLVWSSGTSDKTSILSTYEG
jgi:flagellin-like protein